MDNIISDWPYTAHQHLRALPSKTVRLSGRIWKLRKNNYATVVIS